MSRIFPFLVAGVLIVAYCVAEGSWTGRWSGDSWAEEQQARVNKIPAVLGPWHGEDSEIDERALKQGEIQTYLLRRYRHIETGEVLTVLLVGGRAGPIAVHTPEQCLGGSGFRLTAPAVRAWIGPAGSEAGPEFWHGTFQRGERSTNPEQIEMYWSWHTANGSWVAKHRPRLTFAMQRYLYKLYVSRPVLAQIEGEPAPAAPAAEGTPIPGFIELLLPEIQRYVFKVD
jgi:hypothetical protein